MTCSAPGISMHILGQAAASKSLFIMMQGIKVSPSPWMKSVGVTDLCTASIGDALLRS